MNHLSYYACYINSKQSSPLTIICHWRVSNLWLLHTLGLDIYLPSLSHLLIRRLFLSHMLHFTCSYISYFRIFRPFGYGILVGIKFPPYFVAVGFVLDFVPDFDAGLTFFVCGSAIPAWYLPVALFPSLLPAWCYWAWPQA